MSEGTFTYSYAPRVNTELENIRKKYLNIKNKDSAKTSRGDKSKESLFFRRKKKD